MSVVYEARDFIHNGSYPPMDHDHNADSDRFTDPADAVADALAASGYHSTAQMLEDAADARIEARLDGLSSSPMKEDSPSSSSNQRVKPIPKPDREITKNVDGKFVCTWPNCTEDIKEFGRKCEWNKHMDKHDRPYKCTAEGCEKLPGFTYSGGLLRHEREVHGKHGGPRQSFNCPHPNCKRNAGKGFSRLENLNEHLRRVHTQNGLPLNGGAGDESDDVASETAVATAVAVATNGLMVAAGQKRKRIDGEDVDLREENKRLRQENEELRRQVDNQNRQTVSMMQQIAQLQETLAGRLQPTAPML